MLLFLIIVIFTGVSYAKKKKPEKVLPDDVMAPAIQFNLADYTNYFKKQTKYKLQLKSRYDYKITCNEPVIGVNWGDIDNIKMYDKKNKNNEIIDMKSVYLKARNETYTYVRLYKESGEIMNLILSVSPVFDVKDKITLGLCEVIPEE